MISPLPENLLTLYGAEEALRKHALDLVEADRRLQLHLLVVEAAMDLADSLRQFPTADEDMKVIQLMGIRMFNALATSLKLALSGYSQNSALIMRDILETVFLVDFFGHQRAAIPQWRFADRKQRMREFSPIRIREALDARDGNTGKKRAALYELFSELAAHPSMQSAEMLRPIPAGNAVIGPFLEPTHLDAVLLELGRLAVQVGEVLGAFVPPNFDTGKGVFLRFVGAKASWLQEFYPIPLAALAP
jgi:hypothetical protein